jgi:DNA repair exonuclease SbcCD ATPase subunit
MRIDRYELTNFGAHGHTVYEPGDARLCIIQGENGLGKTTLVSEALGYALYRDFRGSVNGPVRIGQTDGSVAIEFVLNGDRYRAIRRRTTKGAGKSSSDLQIQGPGGAWSPVASGDKEVPAEVRELLHMDAGTFRTSVSLAQRDLERFVKATASERKAILAEIVVDPRFAPAAALAGKRARDLEADLGKSRSHLEQLLTRLAGRPEVEELLAGHRADLEASGEQLAIQAAARDALDERIRTIDLALAAADAIADQVRGLEAERVVAGESWRRAAGRITGATRSIEDAERILASADDVAAAAARLVEVRAQVEVLVAAQSDDTRLAGEISAKAAGLEASNREYSDAVSTHRAAYVSARNQVDALAARAATLEPVICEQCGHPNVVDQAGIREALRAAREEFTALEATGEPKPPTGLLRDKAALASLEGKRRELGFDGAALTTLHREVADLERVAARGEAMAAAQATIERDQATIAEAEAEKVAVAARGQAIATRIAELTVQLAASEPLRAERVQVGAQQTQVRSVIAELERSQTIGIQLVARDEATLEELDRVQAEQDELTGSLKDLQVTLERLRYLAGRFGLKGIPARVIEGVLPELTRYANDALGQLFGLRLDIRATRSSADGKSTIEELDLVVTKDGVGEVEMARASGGQSTAIALAMALGLARLNARRAGTAIRSLVVDEPEGLDVIRLKALGTYLRDLVHTGELDRVFVITHTTELAEFGDRVDEVLEGPDGAYLQQVA